MTRFSAPVMVPAGGCVFSATAVDIGFPPSAHDKRIPFEFENACGVGMARGTGVQPDGGHRAPARPLLLGKTSADRQRGRSSSRRFEGFCQTSRMSRGV